MDYQRLQDVCFYCEFIAFVVHVCIEKLTFVTKLFSMLQLHRWKCQEMQSNTFLKWSLIFHLIESILSNLIKVLLTLFTNGSKSINKNLIFSSSQVSFNTKCHIIFSVTSSQSQFHLFNLSVELRESCYSFDPVKRLILSLLDLKWKHWNHLR